MPRVKILTEADLRKIVSLDLDAVACVETAFEALADQGCRHASNTRGWISRNTAAKST